MPPNAHGYPFRAKSVPRAYLTVIAEGVPPLLVKVAGLPRRGS